MPLKTDERAQIIFLTLLSVWRRREGVMKFCRGCVFEATLLAAEISAGGTECVRKRKRERVNT